MSVKEVFEQVKDRQIWLGFCDFYDYYCSCSGCCSYIDSLRAAFGTDRQSPFVAGFIISLPGMASLVTSGYLGKLVIVLATIDFY